MPIPFTCPHCGHRTNVADQYAGQTGPCAACGESITIPAVYSGEAPPARAGRSSAGPTIATVVLLFFGVFLVCGGILAALLLPAVHAARDRARRSQCQNNLKQIGLAMHNYHDAYGCFPAAVMTDEEGQPMRSWRIALLPFLESSPVYDQYDFSEPWDGPKNQTLLGARTHAYACPTDPAVGAFETSYVMLVGKGTIGGEANEGIQFREILDGTSNTILAIEVAGAGIPWMEPRDMTVEEAILHITSPAVQGHRHVHPGGVNVLMADGSVRFVPETVDPNVLRWMMTRDDGQAIPDF